MSEPTLDIIGAGSKRLTSRRRGKRRPTKRQEVVPQIQNPNLNTPLFGCPVPDNPDFPQIEEEDVKGISVSRQEKDLIIAQSRKQRQKLPELIIDSIQYNILSNEQIQKMAVYEAISDKSEGLFTVNDPRGGVVDMYSLCKTCHLDNMECPGHYGVINLAEAIINPNFRKETVHVLMSVCNSCGGLLLNPNQYKEKGIDKLSGGKRLKAIAEASAGLPCRRAQRGEVQEENILACTPNPIYKTSKLKETGKIYYTTDAKGKENIKSVDEIEAIFESITREDAELLGFHGGSHPIRYIMKSIAVTPLCSRAPVVQDGLILKDDLTSMYQDIVRFNEELKKGDLSELKREQKLKNLIFSIEHFMDNSDKKYGQGGKKKYEDLKSRIQGKKALIRESMMGKRVNFSARTVLGPDPNLKFGQIRIPVLMAPYLTQHEIVNSSNINRLTALLRSGKITYLTPISGRLAGRRIKVNKKIRSEHTLTYGDEIDRWLQNGDYVVFNRQPTLHKQGIMGYEVVLGKPKTIGLHLGYTPQHNAD